MVNYFQNATNLKDLLVIANTITNGWFWLVMNMLIFGIVSISLLGFGFETAMLTASFVSLISGIFLSYMDLMSWSWNLFYVGIILFLILYVNWKKRDYM